MGKVICDVCGTDYPETATQCPICGSARADVSLTAADGTATGDSEKPAYTYVRGGRFSKANVRKRLREQEEAEEKLHSDEETEEMIPVDPDDDEDEDDRDVASNRGLIVVVVLLVLAIIAFSAYLAIEYFGLGNWNDETKPGGTTVPTQSITYNTSEQVRVPCTDVVLDVTAVELVAVNNTMQLNCTREPADTTDTITFASSDESVAIVDEKGLITAVGNGEAVIRVTCGNVVKECAVVCNFEGGTEAPTDGPTDGEEVFELRFTDVTLDKVIPVLQLYRGDLNPEEITWTSSKEDVATVEKGLVTPVSVGTTQITAEYQGQKAVCVVRVTQAALDAIAPIDPTEGTEPTESTDPEEPTEPEETNGFTLMINNSVPRWKYKDQENTADVTIDLSGSKTFRLAIVNDMGADMPNVEWKVDKENVCSVEGKTVTGLEEGIAFLTVTYEGTDYTVRVIVTE